SCIILNFIFFFFNHARQTNLSSLLFVGSVRFVKERGVVEEKRGANGFKGRNSAASSQEKKA
ncbi:hypothetical protein, partial [Enterobacter hormaechei]|uniref:hypothetical protein n=1 Tax=Enterobacter hormaechei TaxID=158836 RepID=UPI001EEF2765